MMALVEALHSARLHDHEMFSVHVTSWSCLEQCCVQHFRFAVENLLLSAMIEAFFWGVVVSLRGVHSIVRRLRTNPPREINLRFFFFFFFLLSLNEAWFLTNESKCE